MTVTSIAAVAWEAGAPFVLEEIEVGDPGPGEVLVELAVTGLCHTDLSVRDGHLPLPLPAVLGHEGAGYVRAVGDGVDSVRVGERVALTFGSCGACANCRADRPYACATFALHNMINRKPGGGSAFHADGREVGSNFFGQSSFSNIVVVEERSVIPIADDIPFELVAPLVCGVLTGAAAVLHRTEPGPVDPIAVFGLGTVGLAAVMAARIRGIETIIAVDPVASRRALATRLGATHVVDPAAGDVVGSIRSIAEDGVQFAVECSGAPGVLDQAIDSLGAGGFCAMVGSPPAGTAVTLDVQRAIGLHLSIGGLALGGANARVLLPQLIDHWREGRLPVDLLVGTFDLARINEVVAAGANGPTVKPVLRFPSTDRPRP